MNHSTNHSPMIIPSGTTYLSEVLSKLPTNCIFDKGRVGGGGTHIALTDKIPTVIAAPFISLIDNKASQHKNVLAVKAGVTEREIKQYVAKTRIPKIMVTYDSLPKVVAALGADASAYNLLVDEYHLLFTQYSFRADAVQRVLSNYKKFKSYCFMTATVLEDEFVLECVDSSRKEVFSGYLARPAKHVDVSLPLRLAYILLERGFHKVSSTHLWLTVHTL